MSLISEDSAKNTDEIDYTRAKFAIEHLGHCEHPECRFCSGSVCCFGMRDVGCVILEPELLRRVDHIASFMVNANKALYDYKGLSHNNNMRFSNLGVPYALEEIEKGITDMFMHLK